MPGELRDLRNLGAASQMMLGVAGIDSTHELTRLGAVEAYVRVEESGATPSLNLLYALEGAISGRSWQEVSRTQRTRLLTELEAVRESRVITGALRGPE